MKRFSITIKSAPSCTPSGVPYLGPGRPQGTQHCALAGPLGIQFVVPQIAKTFFRRAKLASHGAVLGL